MNRIMFRHLAQLATAFSATRALLAGFQHQISITTAGV
jgi:hypothetical protein